jgi:5'-nucleotidase
LLDGCLPEYPKWENYFDFIIVGASKPAFFTEDRKFLALDRVSGEVSAQVEVKGLDKQYIFQGGCIADFERFVDTPGEQILYVGDHIYGDIMRSKKESLWRTALVLDEMEDEIEVARSMREAQVELHDLDERRADLEHEITRLKLSLNKPSSKSENAASKQTLKARVDKRRRQLKNLVSKRDELEARVDKAFNPYWGSVFKEGPDNSCFGRQVERYACLYTSRASNFRFYSPVQYFRAPRHWMAHEKL